MPPALAGSLVAFVVLATAAAWGAPLGARLAPDRPRAGAAVGILFGLVALSRWVYILVELGILSRPLLLAPLLALATNPRGALRAWRDAIGEAPVGNWLYLPAAFFFLFVLPALQVPVVFWDARVYHLGLPEQWIATGGSTRTEQYVFSWYPLLAEGLATYAFLAPRADAGAILLALAPLLLAPALLDELFPSTDPSAHWLALLATPALYSTALLAKGTPLLAVSCLAAIALRDPRAAGAALGAAFAVHPYAAAFAPLALWVWARSGGARGALRAAGYAAFVGGPVYFANLLAAGDPVYPYLSAGGVKIDSYPARHLAEALAGGWEPFGFGSTFGLLLPVGAVLALARRPNRSVLLGALGVIALVLAASGFLRFAAGAVLVVAGAAAAAIDAKAPRALPVLALVGLAEFFHLTYILMPISAAGVIAGRMTPQEYERSFVAEAPLAAWARANLPPRPCVANIGVARQYGWGGRLEPVASWRDSRAVGALRASSSETEAIRRIRAEGFTHIALQLAEWERLARAYDHTLLAPEEHARLRNLLRASRLVGRSGPALLYEIP